VSDRVRRVLGALPWLVVALPALYQVVLLAVAIKGRVAYPYDLEWMEGGLLHHALRIQQGAGIYAPPSADFIPYLYTPLYPAILALVGNVFGLGYTLGRALSVLSLVGIAAVAATQLLATRHAQPRIGPPLGGWLLGLGLFAAGYPYVEGWYDLVRADTFFLLVVTAGISGLTGWSEQGTGWRGHARVAAGGVMLALAFFVKQTGIIYVAFGGFIVLVVNWRRLPAYVAAAGAIGLGFVALLNSTTDGWFWIYTRKLHGQHDTNPDRFWASFKNILWHFPALSIVIVTTLLVVLATWILRRRFPTQARPFMLWTAAYAVSTLVGCVGWSTQFAHFNAYMPALLHGALAGGAAIPALYACVTKPADKTRERVAWTVAMLAALPLAWTCWTARWEPKRFIPTKGDLAAGHRLIARIRSIDGKVWMPSHPWYVHLAGKTPRVHRMGIKDITTVKQGGKPVIPGKVDRLEDMLRRHEFAAVFLDNVDLHNRNEYSALNQNYRAAIELPGNERPRVYTGAPVVPVSIWVPALPATPPAGSHAVFDFETSRWDGWQRSGPAFGNGPVTTALPGEGLVLGATGRYYATSLHGGAKASGRMTSPDFALDGSTLVLHLGGNDDATTVRVELWVEGASVAATGVPRPGGSTLREATIDVTRWTGKLAKLVLVDDSDRGHLILDDVWLR